MSNAPPIGNTFASEFSIFLASSLSAAASDLAKPTLTKDRTRRPAPEIAEFRTLFAREDQMGDELNLTRIAPDHGEACRTSLRGSRLRL